MDRVNSISRSYGSRDITRSVPRRNAGREWKSSDNSSVWRQEPTEEELKQEITRLQNKREADGNPQTRKTTAGRQPDEQMAAGAASKGQAESRRSETGQAADQEAGKLSPTALRSKEQYAAWKSAQEWLDRQKEAKEKKEKSYGLVSQLQSQAEAWKKAMDPKRKKNLYDATMDLTLLEQIEKVPALKAMQSRLMFKIRYVKASGAEASEIRRAVTKLKKVLGKVKGKVKGLQKEEQLEKKRKKAEEAKRKAKEAAVRRELEMRKKIRKAKERKDIEESKMGLGANYGGPSSESAAVSFATDVHTSIEAAASGEIGSTVDVAVAEMGAAAADAGGAVDVSL